MAVLEQRGQNGSVEMRLGATFENGLAISSDGVVRIDNESAGEDVLAVEVGALHITRDWKGHLVAHAVRNIGGKESPLVAAAELLRREAERADLLLLPIASPLVQPGLDVSVEVAVGVAVEALATPLLRGRLGIIRSDYAHGVLRSLLLNTLVLLLCIFDDRFN